MGSANTMPFHRAGMSILDFGIQPWFPEDTTSLISCGESHRRKTRKANA